MELRIKRQRKPVSRLRLALCMLVVVPAFFVVTTGLASLWLVTFMRGQTRLVQLDARTGAGAQDISSDLPGFPGQIAGASDGSLWAQTRMWGSLSRYRDGRWQVFGGDTFGTRADTPDHDFVVVGSHVWAVFDRKLAHFDGRGWHTCDIPSSAQDHVLAADSRAAWVLDNDGVLHRWSQGAWQVIQSRSAPKEMRWDAKQPFRAPELVACEDGSLWLCAQRVWRLDPGQLDRGQWEQVEVPGRPTEPELLGYAGGRLWFDVPGALAWVTHDTADHGHFTLDKLGLDGNAPPWHVCQIDSRVVASSNRGGHVLQDGKWHLKWPAAEGVQRYEALTTAGGRVFAKAITLKPIPALWLSVPFALVLSGLATLGIIRFLKPDYSLLSSISPKHALALLIGVLPFIVGGLVGMPLVMLTFIAPFAISAFAFLVPVFALVIIWARERLERATEIVQFQAVSAGQLPAAVLRWFEQNTAELQLLGFEPIGDFRLKQRREHFGRFFVHKDGTVFGEIAWFKASFLQIHKCIAFFSITDDLTYVETGNLSIPRKEREAPFLLRSVPGATAEETFAVHRSQLDELREDPKTEAICFAPNDLDTVVVYGQKLMYERLKRIGFVRRNPYDDVEVDFDRERAPGPVTPPSEPDRPAAPAPAPPLAGTVDGGGFSTPVG